jgi:hypothetical protein
MAITAKYNERQDNCGSVLLYALCLKKRMLGEHTNKAPISVISVDKIHSGVLEWRASFLFTIPASLPNTDIERATFKVWN